MPDSKIVLKLYDEGVLHTFAASNADNLRVARCDVLYVKCIGVLTASEWVILARTTELVSYALYLGCSQALSSVDYLVLADDAQTIYRLAFDRKRCIDHLFYTTSFRV